MDPILGQIMLVGFTFVPRGWAACDGQLLPIMQNQALFSLLGTTYGGDGRTTFALPDLRGRAPIHVGYGPGLSSYTLGESGGSESVTLTSGNLPQHLHGTKYAKEQTTDRPGPDVYPAPGGSYGPASGEGSPTSAVGGGQPAENRSPFLAMRYVIALEGIYPSRD